jgi:hypothetical protein
MYHIKCFLAKSREGKNKGRGRRTARECARGVRAEGCCYGINVDFFLFCRRQSLHFFFFMSTSRARMNSAAL